MKKILTGNEAIARGAYEYGVTLAAAYPGTPSTEILENIVQYKEHIYCEWAPNEKVAAEVAIGGSIAGARSLAAMKHVGVNVAADPIFTYAYTGVNGGFVLVSADDPGMHSSQNEQDNRYYAKFAKIAMLEPSDSQEAKDFLKHAFEISEKFDTPVLYRVTTRICHSKGIVELGEREETPIKPYVKDISKYVATPANARGMHTKVEKRLKALEDYANSSPLNTIERNTDEVGVITSGVSYQYAKEVFGDKASYLKLGFTFPLPSKLIKDFAASVKKLYIIEELEPYIEEHVRIMGIECIGKDIIPNEGELNTDIVAKAVYGTALPHVEIEKTVVNRPPTMCAGCPHRGLFYELSKKKNVVITGDIGCYTLGSAPPLSAMDTVICMGASISNGHGFQKASEKNNVDRKVFTVIGDSTFFHTGINSLMDLVYNNGTATTIILDNRITGMTGHQDNPGSGFTLMGDKVPESDIEAIVKAIGVKKVVTVDPYDLKATKAALDEAMTATEAMVIITKQPCVLIKPKPDGTNILPNLGKVKINLATCRTCKMCLKVGCPAISLNDGKMIIDQTMCVGCAVCLQVCPFGAMERVGE